MWGVRSCLAWSQTEGQKDRRTEGLTFGVYRFTSGETTSLVDVKAAWISIFPKETAFARFKKEIPDAVVAGRTAAYMHRIGDLFIRIEAY
ncbi:MAG: hypothetical protein RR477_02705 [Raoultibacter sp.]